MVEGDADAGARFPVVHEAACDRGSDVEADSLRVDVRA